MAVKTASANTMAPATMRIALPDAQSACRLNCAMRRAESSRGAQGR